MNLSSPAVSFALRFFDRGEVLGIDHDDALRGAHAGDRHFGMKKSYLAFLAVRERNALAFGESGTAAFTRMGGWYSSSLIRCIARLSLHRDSRWLRSCLRLFFRVERIEQLPSQFDWLDAGGIERLAERRVRILYSVLLYIGVKYI